MKKIFLAFLCVFTSGMAAVASAAEKNDLPDWQNPYVLERNRAPMVSHFETDGLKQTLNGMWDFAVSNQLPDQKLLALGLLKNHDAGKNAEHADAVRNQNAWS